MLAKQLLLLSMNTLLILDLVGTFAFAALGVIAGLHMITTNLHKNTR